MRQLSVGMTLKTPSSEISSLPMNLFEFFLSKYGWLPRMASSSRGQIGALCAESFCERILSCANDVCSEDNTGLGCEEINMLVVLRMNREFMEFMRLNYASASAQLHNMTLVQP